MRSSHGCRIVACAGALAALGCSISASADPIPQGWQASNMEPVGYTDLENRSGAFKMAMKKANDAAGTSTRPSVALRLDHRRRHRSEEPEIREDHSGPGQYLDDSSYARRQICDHGVAEMRPSAGAPTRKRHMRKAC